jgi:AcrR family transcriptional regulator
MPRPKLKNIRQRILKVAAAKFFKSGFYKISIDELVAELRTSKSTIYKHFASKEEIVAALLFDFNTEVDSKLRSIILDSSKNFKEKIEEITEYTGRVLSRVHPRFFNDLKIHTPELWDEYEQARLRRLERFYGALIEQGIEQEIIRDDIDQKFILLMYSKLTEILIRPSHLQDLSVSIVEANKFISKFFLEGAYTDRGRNLLCE